VTPPNGYDRAVRVRCPWAGTDPLMVAYHDDEWGVPTRDERELFELLTLEGAQAGLSWSTILRRREGYRRAFAGFDPEAVAGYGEAEVTALLGDAGIIRNGQKIRSAIANAALVVMLREEGGFCDLLWSYVDGTPIVNHYADQAQIPASTPLSKAISRDLRRRGFSFVGETIVYALLQSAGLVDDHVESCFRRTGGAGVGSASGG
jgi:DNA-3-methyladenine glycosylase I